MCGYWTGVLLLAGLLAWIRRHGPRLGARLLLPGTFCHEATHWCVGKALGARPVRFSLSIRQVSPSRWLYGSVFLERLTPWNRIPVGLSPLLLLPCVWHALQWRVRSGIELSCLGEGILVYALASMFASAWPSREDLGLAFTDSRALVLPLWGALLALCF